jgi:hypothetical protein
MISVIDLEGNSYPIPSQSVRSGDDVHSHLSTRYGLTNLDLFAKQSPLGRSSVLDPDILSGIVPISAIPSEQMTARPTLFLRGGEDDVVSVDRFSHLCFTTGPGSPSIYGRHCDGSSSDDLSDGAADEPPPPDFFGGTPVQAFGQFGMVMDAIRQSVQFFGPLVRLQVRGIQPESWELPLTFYSG